MYIQLNNFKQHLLGVQISLLLTKHFNELILHWNSVIGSFRTQSINESLFLFFHVASVFRMKGLRKNLREKNLFWIDMALRFLTSTLNASSENLIMKVFYKSKFMLKQKCIFNNTIKGKLITKTLKGIHLCINSNI